ncbi:hypothetical protein GCM10023085_27440 [Actinomadura viridis]|uniref:Protein kinase domain-containing protein n=1 Tax=Actinomadura viridis TaxID=58110 RepID=A0A931DHY7_9ACTN|nr:hypothetical protein [Actinomadura viridis]MBG6087270.1 hypothetical protein [Actinomadura viridis]
MAPPGRHGPAFEPLEPGDPPLIGGYRVLARLGTDGPAPAYLATTQSGRRLAVRVVRPAPEDDAFRLRLRREIAAGRRLRGPFLAAVVDGHAEGALPWVATEYVPGPSLARAVDELGPLPVPAVRVLLGAVTRALQAVHDTGAAHGALTPSAVLLAEDGPRLAVSVSPDGPAGDAGGPAGDVYALGRVALFAATGRDAGAEPDLSGCPDELRGPLGRCLAEDPDRRPEPAALVAALEEDPPWEGWPPQGLAGLLSAYRADPDPAPRRAGAAPEAARPAKPTRPDGMPAGAPRIVPNFTVPAPPPDRPPLAAPAGPEVRPVMDSYRHDLVIALGIGGGAFGVLVLVLLLVFLI